MESNLDTRRADALDHCRLSGPICHMIKLERAFKRLAPPFTPDEFINVLGRDEQNHQVQVRVSE
jgi:hypothetical protein